MSNEELEKIFGSYDELFDKDSSLYKQTVIKNANEKKEDKQDLLTTALKEASHLEDDKKKRYLYIADKYISSMQDNIFRNQFELNKYYSEISIDEWNEFLSDRIVSTYVSKHKRTLLKSAAEDNLANPLAKNKRDNLQLIKNIEEQEQSEANKNICIIRIPDIYDKEV